MEQQYLQELAKKARKHPIWEPLEATPRTRMEREQIERILPHRDPFLFVDEITEIDLHGQAIRGRTRISPDDPVFKGHFPGDPIYPGVLQLEMVGQLGLCLVHFVRSNSLEITPSTMPSPVRALKIHFAQFLAPVTPGFDLTIVCRIVEFNDYTVICAGQILNDRIVCSFGVMEVFLIDG